MKSLSLFHGLLLFLFVIMGFVVVSAEAVTLNITVADTQTGNRLNGVSITVTPKTGDATTSISGTTGTLEITDLDAGDYTITASSGAFSFR